MPILEWCASQWRRTAIGSPPSGRQFDPGMPVTLAMNLDHGKHFQEGEVVKFYLQGIHHANVHGGLLPIGQPARECVLNHHGDGAVAVRVGASDTSATLDVFMCGNGVNPQSTTWRAVSDISGFDTGEMIYSITPMMFPTSPLVPLGKAHAAGDGCAEKPDPAKNNFFEISYQLSDASGFPIFGRRWARFGLMDALHRNRTLATERVAVWDGVGALANGMPVDEDGWLVTESDDTGRYTFYVTAGSSFVSPVVVELGGHAVSLGSLVFVDLCHGDASMAPPLVLGALDGVYRLQACASTLPVKILRGRDDAILPGDTLMLFNLSLGNRLIAEKRICDVDHDLGPVGTPTFSVPVNNFCVDGGRGGINRLAYVVVRPSKSASLTSLFKEVIVLA